MKHLDFNPTPIEELSYFSEKWGHTLYCKRDDLFTDAGGGSKVRMLQYILYPLVENKIQILITAGGPCSNYNRAAALMCGKLGIKMKLVSYADSIDEYHTSLNHYIAQLSQVDFIFCSKQKVFETIQQTIDEVKSSGKTYAYLYGGGKSLEGVFAYYDAVKELKEQFEYNLDEVYVACGTGTTLTGICAGMQEFFPNVKVHAISVARSWELEKKVLDEEMAYINEYLNTSYNFSNMCFHDDFIIGGYGCTSNDQLKVIKECMSKQGLLIDPTYSGKAFYGMSKILTTYKKHKSILFWHTGGIFNLLSQKKVFGL